MPRTIRIHLDENCSHAIAAGLRRRGIDVTTSSEVGLLGAIEEDQLAYCQAEGRVIVSIGGVTGAEAPIPFTLTAPLQALRRTSWDSSPPRRTT
jgi:hypothetical protein